MTIRLPRAAVWTCAVVLGAVFVLIGLSKVTGPSAVRWGERFAQWGYPGSTRHLIGLAEMLGGLSLLIPISRRAGAAILAVIMMGALVTHAVSGEFPRLIPPLVLGGLALLLYASRK
jgi:uncharacterized membrane protein YphA (DoxX/SURF4 family)